METSIFAFPTDLLDEGVEPVLDNVQGRAGLGGITLAAVYHAARDVFPHNPARRLRYLENGVCYFRTDASRYAGLALQPRVSRLVEQGDPLVDLVQAAGRRGLAVHAWTVYLHVDWVDEHLAASCEQTAFGDPRLTELCPANPGVAAYVRALTGDVASRGVGSVLAESLHYHPLEHGYHHERYFLPLGARTRLLLGLCFCEHCLAAARARGADAERLRRWACDEIQRVFDGGPDVDASEELGLEEARGLAGGELAALLDARADAVAAVALAAGEAAAAEGAAFTFLDFSGAVKGYVHGRPTGGPAPEIAWTLGVDLGRVGSAVGLEAIAYAADPDRVRLDLETYRACAPGTPLAAAMRFTPPDCDSAENLAAKLRLAAELGVARTDFYHYGFAPLPALDLIREAVDAAGSAAGV